MFYLYEEQIIKSVKQIIKKYENALHLVVIYGSFARQQHTPNSDLDLLIVGDERVKK
ncbi:MAG: nucleotidyltransferase domain-containing protein [Candidatus Odinarchaeota archaeon]|nr:nucleotidyltransferase domain-containing protein [Candidatus Odinarchaeota archaeon]